MKIRYIITLDPDEEAAVCVTRESEPDAITAFIIARTPEEAHDLAAQAGLRKDGVR